MLMKLAGLLMMVLAIASPMLAGAGAGVPEIDAGSATAAIALLSGSLLILKARKKK